MSAEMNVSATLSRRDAACYELRFQSLFDPGRALAFPCDADGHVDMDVLGDKARHNYLYARAVVGREYAAPAVLPSVCIGGTILRTSLANEQEAQPKQALQKTREALAT